MVGKEGKKLYVKSNGLDEKIKDWGEPKIPERGLDILKERYLMKDDEGNLLETPKEALYRVAHVVASADSEYGDFDAAQSEKKFYDLMAEGYFYPNSPTIKGAGLDINLSACYVLPVGDSREEIFETLGHAVEVQAFGGGTGFNFSELRPKGSRIKSTGGISSGLLSFLDVYDLTIGKVIAQGGTRQGANMAIDDYTHGDIEDFINVKSDPERLRNFNLSVGVTKEFMEGVKEEKKYDLINHKGEVIKTVEAKEIFDQIIDNAWNSGDPGLIFLDRLENDNPTPNIGKIVSTNPCGEQPLLPYESCNLGSINLSKFVKNEKIDYEHLRQVVDEGIHFLDNVIDVNTYPLAKSERKKERLTSILRNNFSEQNVKAEGGDLEALVSSIVEDYAQSPIDKIVKGNRKIGLGVMGWANALIKLGVPYGTEESFQLAKEVQTFITKTAADASVKLAKTRGVFPNWEGSIYDPKSGNFKGEDMKPRNAARTTNAPTGTLCNFVGTEGGIEPIYLIAYMRKSVFDEQGNAKYEFPVFNPEFESLARKEGFYSEKLFQDIMEEGGVLKGVAKPERVSEERWDQLAKLFITAHEVPYRDQLMMQAAFQGGLNGNDGVDNAVSKTINLPNTATKEDIRDAYLFAYELGNIKGLTVYRDKSRDVQVLTAKSKRGLEKLALGESENRPKIRGTTIKQETPHGTAFITLNVLKDNLEIPYESFINVGKGGQDISAIAEGYGRVVSLAMQYGVPIEKIIEQLGGIGGGTQKGFGKSRLLSLPDALSKGIAEGYSELTKGGGIINSDGKFSGDLCPECQSKLIHAEGCTKCISCDYTKC